MPPVNENPGRSADRSIGVEPGPGKEMSKSPPRGNTISGLRKLWPSLMLDERIVDKLRMNFPLGKEPEDEFTVAGSIR